MNKPVWTCTMCGFPLDQGEHCIPIGEDVEEGFVNFQCRIPVVTYNAKRLGTVHADTLTKETE